MIGNAVADGDHDAAEVDSGRNGVDDAGVDCEKGHLLTSQ